MERYLAALTEIGELRQQLRACHERASRARAGLARGEMSTVSQGGER